jgi:hypothetical protein
MTVNQETITIGFLIANIVLLLWNFYLVLKLGRLLRGKNARTLEDTVQNLAKNLEGLNKFKSEISNYLSVAEKRLARNTAEIKTVRFNPWKGTGDGGNQSFAVAFLSERGNGVILSSLYSRERVSVFAKPVENFKSPIELTDEEKEALGKTKENLKVTG